MTRVTLHETYTEHFSKQIYIFWATISHSVFFVLLQIQDRLITSIREIVL